MKKWLLLTMLLISFCFAQEYKIGTCINNENVPSKALTPNNTYSTSRILGNTSKIFICKNVNNIILDLNGGAFSQNNLLHNLSVTDYTFANPTKLGHTFSGWTGTGISSPTSNLTITKDTTGNKEYKANWTANSYTYNIAYKSSSGKQLGTDTITKNFGTTNTISPKDFTGYTSPSSQSIVWDSAGVKTIEFIYTPISYSVSYVLSGGTGADNRTYTIETATFDLPTPTKTGYSFAGWYETDNYSGSAVSSISQGSIGDKTFYANWTPNSYTYNIVYKSSSGKQLGTDTITKDFGTTNTISPVSFTGYTNPSSQSVVWDSVNVKTITFVYEPISYTITWNLDGGSLSGQKTTYTVEDENYTLPTPSRTGYVFSGWYTSSDFSGTAVTSIPKGSTGNKMLYAKWEESIKTYVMKTGSAFNALIPSTTTSIVFTDEIMPANATLINVDADGDNGVVAWLDGTTFKVSTRKTGQKIIANEDSSNMFNGNSNLVAKNIVSITGLENLDTSNVIDMSLMFFNAGYNATSFAISGLSSGNVSKVTNMQSMFQYAGYNATSFNLDLSTGDTSNVTDMSYMFSNIGSKATTTSVNLNLSNWDTSNVTDMSYMFAFVGEKAGKVIISGLENWNTSKVENMTYMFCRAARYNCISFSLNLSNWDTSNVTLMNQMFSSVGQYITTLSLQGLANGNTSKVTNMNNMFNQCGQNATFSLNLSKGNVSKVTYHSNFNKKVTSKVIPPTGVN